MTESELQNKIINDLNKLCYNFKTIKANINGIPDITLCLDGKFIAIEVKKPNMPIKFEPLQPYNIYQIVKNKGNVIITNDPEFNIKDILKLKSMKIRNHKDILTCTKVLSKINGSILF